MEPVAGRIDPAALDKAIKALERNKPKGRYYVIPIARFFWMRTALMVLLGRHK